MPQLPHGEALDDQTECDDQGGGLRRVEDVKPNGRCDQPEGKSGHTCDQRRSERRPEKY